MPRHLERLPRWIPRGPPDLASGKDNQVKARGFGKRCRSRQEVTRGVEELIHAGRATGIQKTPEVLPGGQYPALESHRAEVIKPAGSYRKEDGLKPGD